MLKMFYIFSEKIRLFLLCSLFSYSIIEDTAKNGPFCVHYLSIPEYTGTVGKSKKKKIIFSGRLKILRRRNILIRFFSIFSGGHQHLDMRHNQNISSLLSLIEHTVRKKRTFILIPKITMQKKKLYIFRTKYILGETTHCPLVGNNKKKIKKNNKKRKQIIEHGSGEGLR